jgi:apolipoprotein N-acyltransferase
MTKRTKASLQSANAHAPARPGDGSLATKPAWWQRHNVRLALAGLLSALMLNLCFAPWDCWMLAYIALVPWTLAMAWDSSTRRAVVWSGLAGLAFWAASLYWLWWITLVGYFGTLIYLPCYWLIAAIIVRSAMRRNWPAAFVLPVVWVSLEYARNFVISGFPWFFMGHSQYAQLAMIQIADFAGQYGVSFVVVMINGAIVDAIRLAMRRKSLDARIRRRLAIGLASSAAILIATLSYGQYRLGQQTTRPGPAVGIVQQAFPIHLGRRGAGAGEMFQRHMQASLAFVGAGCDFVLWPESMLLPFMNHQALEMDLDQLSQPAVQDLSRRFGTKADAKWYLDFVRSQAGEVADLSKALDCPVIAGGQSLISNPSPIDDQDHWLVYNSAMMFDRSWKESGQYAKVHLVPFSEYVPYKRTYVDFYRALRWFVPDVMEQLEPGTAYNHFTVPSKTGQWRVATPICYEGTFDRVCRNLVIKDGVKSVDLLANISNDGWFVWKWFDLGGSTEQAQHMVQYCFRAVENRVPVIRAVNTGISASIDSTGRVVAKLNQGGKTDMVTGQLLLKNGARSSFNYQQAVQVLVDSRTSVYSLYGNVFAAMVAGLCGLICILLAWKRPIKGKGPSSDEQ